MPAHHSARGLFAALAGLSCLAAAGCGGSQLAAATAQGRPASQGPAAATGGSTATPSTVLPAQPGDTWVYAVDSSALGKGTEMSRITAVTPAAGGQRATMLSTLRLAGSTAPFRFTSHFTAGNDGSVTFGSASFMGAKFSAANASWPSPASLVPGHPHTSTVTGRFLGVKTTERVTVSNAGPATVTVPAGTYPATLLEQTMTDRSGNRNVIKAWVVTGIGQVKVETSVIVKGQRAVSIVETLTSFTKG